ncbi:hypothetical protein ACFL0M_00085 [Thermodesulfobacteriota bacterium]
MMDNIRNSEWLFDMDKATDIEVAMGLIRLMNGHIELVKAQGNGNSKNLYFKMAENSLKTMQNPFAKKLLLDKMEEVKAYT